MTSPNEPREVFPVVIFRDRPAFGDFRPGATVKKDFRAKVVAANDALPTSPPVVEVTVEPDPKASPSATASATPSANGFGETQITLNSGTPPTLTLSDVEGAPAPAERDTPPTPNSPTESGSPEPPVEVTGPQQGAIDPPPTPTLSSLLADRRPMPPSGTASDAQ